MFSVSWVGGQQPTRKEVAGEAALSLDDIVTCFVSIIVRYYMYIDIIYPAIFLILFMLLPAIGAKNVGFYSK